MFSKLKTQQNKLPDSSSENCNEDLHQDQGQSIESSAGRYPDDGKRKKKIKGVFRTALAHSISKQVAERLIDEDKEGIISSAVSKAVVEYLIRGKDSDENYLEMNRYESKSSRRIETKGGVVHDLLLNLLQAQRTWYLTGEVIGVDDEIPLAPPMIPPAYPHLVQLGTNMIPSPTVFHALHPTMLWVPEAIKKPVAKSMASTLPFSQSTLDAVMKSNLEWVLMDDGWRSWVKNSTTGYIVQQTNPSTISTQSSSS